MNIGVYTEVIREVVARINKVSDTLDLKTIQIMPKETRLQQDMMPYVLIQPDTQFITEEYGASMQQNRKDATINLIIWVAYPIVDRDSANQLYGYENVIDSAYDHVIDNANILLAYDNGEGIGFLGFLERLLDAINTSNSEVNPQIVSSPTRSIQISVNNVIKNEQNIEAEILLSIKTQPFVINNRQNSA